MDFFDKEDYLNQIYSEFKKFDEFYDRFRILFKESIYSIVEQFYPELERTLKLDEDIRLYAEEILSSAESVIYKDRSYPEYRLQEELGIMTRIVVKEPLDGQEILFIQAVHRKAKELMVSYYPVIHDLSGNGFRLLEKVTLMYNWEFVVSFYSQMSHREEKIIG